MTGKSTKQLMEAPRSAAFVCVSNPNYYRQLCMDLQRQDLMIVRLCDIERRLPGWRGAIVIDHAALPKMSRDEQRFLMALGKCYTIPPVGVFV